MSSPAFRQLVGAQKQHRFDEVRFQQRLEDRLSVLVMAEGYR